jgi:hypothetical protein
MAQNRSASRTRGSADASSHQNVSERIRRMEGVSVELPVVGQLRLPRPDHVAYYGGLGALAVLQLIEWPVAVVLGLGHALAENHHSRVAHELGEALEQA